LKKRRIQCCDPATISNEIPNARVEAMATIIRQDTTGTLHPDVPVQSRREGSRVTTIGRAEPSEHGHQAGG
jgi:hypothetical protein